MSEAPNAYAVVVAVFGNDIVIPPPPPITVVLPQVNLKTTFTSVFICEYRATKTPFPTVMFTKVGV
jgi:hypothetical protein